MLEVFRKRPQLPIDQLNVSRSNITYILNQAEGNWINRWNPKHRKKFYGLAQNLASLLTQTPTVVVAVSNLTSKEHGRAFNLLAQLIPPQENLADFFGQSGFLAIEGYFLAAPQMLIPFNEDGFLRISDKEAYQKHFARYVVRESDYSDIGPKREVLRRLSQHPQLTFLNRERFGEIPHY